ncbi:MAG TPA: DUF72 domain-containing protein [Acidobacteriaceae bacterium]|jgi:uncharacterized protein YecE (DUF72 family)|nr:DUF72 domain-containing protein [Acidobacteriaceae bacterium]
MAKTANVRIGISGWRYAGWRGVFYPPRLAQRRELEFAASTFPTIEINGTFYSLQRPESFRRWRAETPDDFIFAVKGSRYLTHMLKLRNPEQPLANFFASGLLTLGPKLGPILWQFAPQMRFDRQRFAGFFDLLPRTHAAAARLARLHDARLKGRAVTRVARGTAAKTSIRHAIEIRDESFATEEFIDLLRKHDIGLVVADTVEWPLLFDLTSDFVYCRLHGSEQLYASGYGDVALDLWADRVAAWATGTCAPLGGRARRAGCTEACTHPRDVYVLFDNDAKVRAPFDAQTLQAKVADRLRTWPAGSRPVLPSAN